MPENARHAGLFDQFEDEHPIADWGGDELFTRMPRPRPVDDAPAPRFRPSLVVSDAPPAPAAKPRAPRPLALVPPEHGTEPAPARRFARTGDEAMRERAERLGLSVVEPPHGFDEPAPTHRFDESGSLIEPEPGERRTKVITGHPGEIPRPLRAVRSERRRPSRTPAEWVGARPERIVGWAFALGLLLILIAISTADAATL
jgi:hypothetical protein